MRAKCILVLVATLCIAACKVTNPENSANPPRSTPATEAPEETIATQQLSAGEKLIADKNWMQALPMLSAIVNTHGFSKFSADFRYRALSEAGRVAYAAGQPGIAHDYLVRVITMPRANVSDWTTEMLAANRLRLKTETVSCLVTIVERWPDRIGKIPARGIIQSLAVAKALSHDVALRLELALYKANWNPALKFRPSEVWRDLALLLMEKHRLQEATEVLARVTDEYVLIAIRADRRFDAVVAAHPAQFDIIAAARRELEVLQITAEKTPDSLESQNDMLFELLHQQRYAAMLAACDSVVQQISSTNFPQRIFRDYDTEYNWFLTARAFALMRMRRWDDAVEELRAASKISEDGKANITQLLALANLDNNLGRPHDALAVISGFNRDASPFGLMWFEDERLEAAVQLDDRGQIARSLDYLKAHRADDPSIYQWALVVVNQPETAAKYLISRLLDEDEREDALQSVQTYALPPDPDVQLALRARWRAVVYRPEVQAAIRRVGKVASYPLEER